MKTTSLNLAVAGLLLAGASAQALDLTAGGSGTINGGFFTTTDVGATGTGLIDSFVRINPGGSSPTLPAGSEEGYNASARPVMADVNSSPSFTHDIQLSAVPLVNIGGNFYYEFLLDINQVGSDPLLSLDELQLYTRSTALTTADTLIALTGSSTLRYDLDAIVDSEILLNYNLNSGSGSGDLFAYIPQGAFAGALATDYVYLYSKFGASTTPPPGGYDINDGFEEWAVRTPGGTSVPDGGATLMLLGAGLAVLGAGRRFLKF